MNDRFSLDALDQDGEPSPFAVTHGGTSYRLADPRTLSWRAIAALGTGDLARDTAVLLGDRAAEFTRFPLPRWKFDRMTSAWRRHYGLGEARASSIC
ncbi:hypothetical protein ADL21_11115 [Streptomyces albus subsp. albus]|nr:hypothetical protein ADL21_11115 [Streptomyces albus subsp. albus]